MDFSHFDQRGYPVTTVEAGYAAWSERYEDTVLDVMDLRLFARLPRDWSQPQTCIDLACGTGRVASWLKERAQNHVIDGVDITEAMLVKARARGVYRDLQQGDIRSTPCSDQAYTLALCSLADEHLPELAPLYQEASRLLEPGGDFALVGYHPFFSMMLGIPTHFDDASGQSVTIPTHVHLTSDHIRAGLQAGFELITMEEGLIDDDWIAAKPKWAAYQHRPVSFAMLWRKNRVVD